MPLLNRQSIDSFEEVNLRESFPKQIVGHKEVEQVRDSIPSLNVQVNSKRDLLRARQQKLKSQIYPDKSNTVYGFD